MASRDPAFQKERTDKLMEAWNIIDKKVPIIEGALKEQFRNLLGVSKLKHKRPNQSLKLTEGP